MGWNNLAVTKPNAASIPGSSHTLFLPPKGKAIGLGLAIVERSAWDAHVTQYNSTLVNLTNAVVVDNRHRNVVKDQA